ncbi:MAG TPA: prepilin peptidase [Propionibacteriaceae bacterium]|nr:prepilin peptidase [Propionibacteriaceae bacterium]
MWILLAGILGLLIGSFVNVVAYRLPAGISLLRRSQCPHCAAPIRPWQNIPVISWLILRARCASCSTPISARYPAVEIVTAVMFAALAGYLPLMGLSGAVAVVAWIAYAWFAASSVVLVLIDLDTRRLPDAVVWPSLGVGLLAFVIAWPLGADTWALPRALAGMAIMFACYFLIRFIRPDGMGGGDVKLAAVAGLFLGWLGWGALAVGWLSGFIAGGVFGIVMMAVGRANRGSAIAFGPWLLVGTWIGILFGNGAAQQYLAVFGLA